MDRAKNFVGQNFWARGYYVSTVGRDEAEIREYIREQEKEDQTARSAEDVRVKGNAGVAGQTALSGSQIKPPALPEVHDFRALDQTNVLTEDDLVDWDGLTPKERDHYLITEDSEPAPMGASLGWLLQLDGDNHRNAFLNSPRSRRYCPSGLAWRWPPLIGSSKHMSRVLMAWTSRYMTEGEIELLQRPAES